MAFFLTANSALAASPLAAIPETYRWQQMSGKARQLLFSDEGTLWAVGTIPKDAGYLVHRADETGWEQHDFGVDRLFWAGKNEVWGILANHPTSLRLEVSPLQTSNEKPDWCVKDVAMSVSHLYILDCIPVTGGTRVMVSKDSAWKELPGMGGVQLVIDPQNRPWIVNDQNVLYQGNESGNWKSMGADVKQVVINAKGKVWGIRKTVTNADSGAHNLFKYKDSRFIPVNGLAEQIAVHPDGTPWIVNAAGEIFKGEEIKSQFEDL